jgi:nitroreductase/NAD-dependent dihydropyrimidine dehydrogenase PreA subunit
MPTPRTPTLVIDPDLCTGCGACLDVCPSRTISLVDDVATVTGTESMRCGHCEAVCAEEAITSSGPEEGARAFRSFAFDPRWLPPEEADLGDLVRLMASRRSCRSYTDEPVPRDQLEDLVRAGITAPSGTNSQAWTFTLLPDRAAMVALGEGVLGFYEHLDRLAGSWLLRTALAWVGRPELKRYHEGYRETIRGAIREYREEGCDRLWHGATAGIVVGSGPGASCGAEDALLATQNILLAAHAMGLGTCLIGFAVVAMQRDRSISAGLGIPPEEEVHAVIALGNTAERYVHSAGRRVPVMRWVGEA